jgi:hypothetical protein
MLRIDAGFLILGLSLISAGFLVQRSPALIQSKAIINSMSRGLSSFQRKHVSVFSRERMASIVAARMFLASGKLLLSLVFIASPVVAALLLDRSFDLGVAFHLLNADSRMMIFGVVVLGLLARHVSR